MSSVSSQQHASGLAAGLLRLQPQLDAASARVSSGRRIDRPAQDSAGLGLAAKLEGSRTRLEGVGVNLQNGVSRLQVTAGHLDSLAGIVTRLGELATLSTEATRPESDRRLYATEFAQLQEQLRQTIGGSADEIGGRGVDRPLATFNGMELFAPGSGELLAAGADPAETVRMPTLDLRAGALGALVRQDAAGAFQLDVDSPGLRGTLGAALDDVVDARARTGAVQSRLERAADTVTTARVNHEAALSAITDTDLAVETTRLTRLNILAEGHTAMLAQAREADSKLLPLLARS